MFFHHCSPKYILVLVSPLCLCFPSGLLPQNHISISLPLPCHHPQCRASSRSAATTPSVTPNTTLRTAGPEVSVRISTILNTVFRGFTQHVPAECGVSQTRLRSCTFCWWHCAALTVESTAPVVPTFTVCICKTSCLCFNTYCVCSTKRRPVIRHDGTGLSPMHHIYLAWCSTS